MVKMRRVDEYIFEQEADILLCISHLVAKGIFLKDAPLEKAEKYFDRELGSDCSNCPVEKSCILSILESR
jgi:hypothetical protein